MAITPHLWFEKESKEAAQLYTSALPDSKITSVKTLRNRPSGDCDLVSFELCGQPFMSIAAGPLFRFNPSISFQVKCNTKDEVDGIWEKFSEGGKVLMPLGTYPFSQHYGWLEDRYGLSWQVMFVGSGAIQQRITPVLMFTGKVCGKAEEAMNFYASLFGAPAPNVWARYGKGEEPDREGSVKFASFSLLGQEFGAMDSAGAHDFAFNEAISFMVPCDTQEEIDLYWNSLSADPKAEQCGWLKDKFGVSWQIVPTIMSHMLADNDGEKVARVTRAFLKMKKFDIEALKRAYDGTTD
jgi:predicted 3-demethylubiquinone-9 3-methyltransferase (glyoxalase superfamily)